MPALTGFTLLGWGTWSWFPDLASQTHNWKNSHILRSYGLLGVLNTLLAFSYTGETDYDKKSHCFLNIVRARQSSIVVNIQSIFTCMTIQQVVPSYLLCKSIDRFLYDGNFGV